MDKTFILDDIDVPKLSGLEKLLIRSKSFIQTTNLISSYYINKYLFLPPSYSSDYHKNYDGVLNTYKQLLKKNCRNYIERLMNEN